MPAGQRVQALQPLGERPPARAGAGSMRFLSRPRAVDISLSSWTPAYTTPSETYVNCYRHPIRPTPEFQVAQSLQTQTSMTDTGCPLSSGGAVPYPAPPVEANVATVLDLIGSASLTKRDAVGVLLMVLGQSSSMPTRDTIIRAVT
ncbi:hypothetical protein ColTof4_06158 [Colletotrichum tofieldiae]|nr:hypothetical protein ColTof3_01342 [Colletotrichum tofieldiae]GKT73735.1 hypothetical protein ColTof4_06158 [Colletotrichum tofieldiae]GKT95693.1 hypothetical protein Ct61P_13543 [Colletotrichum tofieldiae]